jgi:NAD dependent epimerase/dehydratase family enzyme
MLPAFEFGAGGPLGSGRQFMSWVSIEDVLGLFQLALADDAVAGPLNICAPKPVANREFARTLASVLGRPGFIPAPSFALKLLPGGMGSETLLASQRALPRKALARGYQFAFTELGSALRHQLGYNWK